MAETKNEQQPHSFKRKLGNTTYTVKVHFSKDTDKTFRDRVQRKMFQAQKIPLKKMIFPTLTRRLSGKVWKKPGLWTGS